jgi:hypothetical protein
MKAPLRMLFSLAVIAGSGGWPGLRYSETPVTRAEVNELVLSENPGVSEYLNPGHPTRLTSLYS